MKDDSRAILKHDDHKAEEELQGEDSDLSIEFADLLKNESPEQKHLRKSSSRNRSYSMLRMNQNKNMYNFKEI